MSIKHLKALMLCTVATASVVLVSCGGDDNTVVENSIAPTNPSGFVVMAHPDEVVNGDTATLLVRINPSTAKLTKDQLTIDCVSSDIYNLKTDDASASSRSSVSYVQTSSNYTLVDLVPDTLGNDTLQGQWQAKVLVKTDKNIFDKSTLALVANYKDSEGKTVNVSSDPFQMTLVPTPDDGVTAWTPRLYTDSITRNANNPLTPYYWVVTENTYQNAYGVQMNYDVDQRIRSTHFALGTIDNDTTTIALTKIKDDYTHFYGYRPLDNKVPFSEIEAGNLKYYRDNTFFTMVDKTGHEAVFYDKCTYSRFGIVVGEVDCPAQLKAGEEYIVNLGDQLKDYGYSNDAVEYFGNHKCTYKFFGQDVNYHRGDLGGITNLGFKNNYNNDGKSLHIKVVNDCDADSNLKALTGAVVELSLKYSPEKTKIATFILQLKRKGAE